MADKKEKRPVYVLPEGRLINGALFERDIFKDPEGHEGKALYKVEMTFDWGPLTTEKLFMDGDEPASLEDLVVFAAMDKWGDAAEKDYENGLIESPFKDGDEIAAERAKNEKPGDAYKGKCIIRADTAYNKDGVEGVGGISVYGPDANELPLTERELVFNGSYGIVAVTIKAWELSKRRGVKFYLNSYQYTREGERLRGVAPNPFKPVGRTAGAASGGRRSRRG